MGKQLRDLFNRVKYNLLYFISNQIISHATDSNSFFYFFSIHFVDLTHRCVASTLPNCLSRWMYLLHVRQNEWNCRSVCIMRWMFMQIHKKWSAFDLTEIWFLTNKMFEALMHRLSFTNSACFVAETEHLNHISR